MMGNYENEKSADKSLVNFYRDAVEFCLCERKFCLILILWFKVGKNWEIKIVDELLINF